MSRPDCFIAGFYKCGTTSLYLILKQHKKVLVSEEKENIFFGDKELFEKGIKWYERNYYNFLKESEEQKILEINPGLSRNQGTAARLRRFYDPDTPIVFIMRNPVDFFYSHFRFEMRRGFYPLREMIACQRNTFAVEFDNFIRTNKKDLYNYKYFFSKQIQEYKRYFNNIKFIFLEDLHQDPKKVYKEITDFFCLEYDAGVNVNINANVSNYISKYVLVKKMHVKLKFYNRQQKMKNNSWIMNKFLILTEKLEEMLITIAESNKHIDNSKMLDKTRKYLENYFTKEKKQIEQLVDRRLDDIWW